MRVLIACVLMVTALFNSAHAEESLDAQLWRAAVSEAGKVWTRSIGALNDLPEGKPLRKEIEHGTTVPLMILSQRDPDQPPSSPEVRKAFEQVWGALKIVYPALSEAGRLAPGKANKALETFNKLHGKTVQEEYPDTVADLNGPSHTGPIAASSTKTREESRERASSQELSRSFGPRSLAEMERWRNATDQQVNEARDRIYSNGRP
jgi:hypothetical protein